MSTKSQKYNLPTGETVWLVPVIDQNGKGSPAFTIEDEMNFFSHWKVGDMLQMVDHGNGNWDIRYMSAGGYVATPQPQPSQEPQKSVDSMSEDELDRIKREFLEQLKMDLLS